MQTTIKVIIVEDEIAAQKYLQNLLEKNFPNISVLAVADNVPDAIKAVETHHPDILFLDIEIKMGTGFDVLLALPSINAEVIFATSFNQFAIDAFKYHAVDYLLKPLEDKRAVEAISRSINRITQKNSSQQISQLLQFVQQPALPKQRLAIHTIEGIEMVGLDDIVFVEANGNYTAFKLKNGAKVTASRKLKDIEEQLPANEFIRIHNSYVVNMQYVQKYFRGRGGLVIMTDGTSLPVSAARKDEFIQYLGEKS